MTPPVQPVATKVEETVVRHLHEQLQRAAQAQTPVRRGPAHQRGERQQEQAARRHAVEVGYQLVDQGLGWNKAANLLDLTPRTLRSWRQEATANPAAPAAVLGRPVLRSPREQRNEVIRLLDEVGPALGVPALREAFPELLRAELADLLARYRRVWRKRQQEPLRVLHWHGVGRVWAIDFTGPLPPIEGRYPYLLAVRDLASGQQLLWQPCEEATAAVAAAALAELFRQHGAPLVLKCDNGSAFTAGTVVVLAQEFSVELLFSPPGWPRYNGAVEAGIGSLKTRTAASAARHGRPGQWTLDDVAAALLEANATARPHGESGPTPEELWQHRAPITSKERALFQAEVQRQRQEIAAQGGPEMNPKTDLHARARERQTIRRALEGLGYLTYTRRRIPLPIRKQKAAIIT